MARLSPWETLSDLARQNGWQARTTYAQNGEWASWALRVRHPNGTRAIGLWRGRPGGPLRFSSGCRWGGPGTYLVALSGAELKALISE